MQWETSGFRSLWQPVSTHSALRAFFNRLKKINAAVGTPWSAISQIREEIIPRHFVFGLFVVLQSPLLSRAINLTESVNAGVKGRGYVEVCSVKHQVGERSRFFTDIECNVIITRLAKSAADVTREQRCRQCQ